MRSELQKPGIANLSLPPSLVWEQVMASLHEAHPNATLQTIARLPSIAIIKYARTQATGSDAFRAIESSPTRNVAENDPRPFLQFSVVHTIGCGLHRGVGFGHPELIRLLRYSNAAIYIDGTFKMVPAPFRQCLIVMVKDLGVDVYVPAMYVLMDSKHQDAYWNALNFVIIQTGRLLEPATVTCDFERGLMNAVIEQFPLVKIMGCLFHWKQALRRKMVELRIPQDQIAAALSSGMVDVLTIIPVAEIAD
uniref:MULE transposase domain-containing protein n=1 Tax=Phytophthora ramorum TaxID=164328 RepID=H3GZT0_PHYRM